MQPDLPPTYYLDNVLTLFDHVVRVYADILDPGQIEFIETFDALGADAQKLQIRLLNRSHDYYRIGKLNYAEIEDLPAAIEELAQAGGIALDPEIEPGTLLSLFTKPELLSPLEDKSALARLRRAELESQLLDNADDDYFSRLQRRDRMLQVLQREHYQLCQMLFFGNLNQSMTDFVLRDLGLYQFESYPIAPANRPYRNQAEIRQHWLIHQIETLFALGERDDPATLVELADLLPGDIDDRAPAFRKSERLRYEIARQLERLGETGPALEIYRRCRLPPCRERMARILAAQQQAEAALLLCRDMIAQPIDETEVQFATQFARRLGRRHRLEIPPQAKCRRNAQHPETVELELDYRVPVEIAVAEHYADADGDHSCHFVENNLFNGVLGLLLWDVIFAPVQGAFFNPFQYRPSDFYAHDFCTRRAPLLRRTWRELDTIDKIRRRVRERWHSKFGLMNPLVNWQALDPDTVELALERIEYRHWRAVFERILGDLRNNRAGFPDLVHFPPAGGYCLIEVKGPGDSLQKNQQRWIQFFRDQGIPHRLARVTWKTG